MKGSDRAKLVLATVVLLAAVGWLTYYLMGALASSSKPQETGVPTTGTRAGGARMAPGAK